MSVIAIVLPLAIILAMGFLYAFVRAVRSGQYDDLDSPALRAIQDDPIRHAGPRSPRPIRHTPQDSKAG